MDFYTPLFSKIVDSSLWREQDFVIKIFLTMLAKKDRDNVVRGNAYNIGEWSKKTEKEALEALKILAAPDTRRLEPQPHEGRRIQKVEDGWFILNGKYYQEQMAVINRRAQKAASEKRRREKIRDFPDSGTPLKGEVKAVKAYGDGKVDKNFQPIAPEGT